MRAKVAELQSWIDQISERKATMIGQMWWRLNNARQPWLDEQLELRNFIFATDTSTTTAGALPWKNSTTLPKLTQIRDNLHANYLSTIMPNDSWMRWEGYSHEDSVREKRNAIQHYMENKTREGNLRSIISDLLLDYIDGNCFGQVNFVNQTSIDPETEEEIPGYIGPVLERISPMDIVFDPTAAQWEDTPSIVRKICTLGDLRKMAEDYPEYEKMQEAVTKANDLRRGTSHYSVDDFRKIEAMQVDGFGSFFDYLASGHVEVLEFEGDLYDAENDVLMRNRRIIVIDRAFVLAEMPIPTWMGKTTRFHTGWRKRPDNLYGMGPLNNLVGMQYRIDHLENLKADVFDLVAFPPLKIIGDVEDFEWGPFSRIYIHDEAGDVQTLSPDVQALNADTQIALLEQRMEEYAGAPRQAMGIRTPGEKTAFEVQALENAAGRIFQEKITNFEVNFLEPALNAMLESARRNMTGSDVIRVMDDDTGLQSFLRVTKEDITASGKIRPIGARHFSQNAQTLQNLTGLLSGAVGQLIAPHVSGKNLARMAEDILGLSKHEVFREFIAIDEQLETQERLAEAQQEMQMTEETE